MQTTVGRFKQSRSGSDGDFTGLMLTLSGKVPQPPRAVGAAGCSASLGSTDVYGCSLRVLEICRSGLYCLVKLPLPPVEVEEPKKCLGLAKQFPVSEFHRKLPKKQVRARIF